MTVPRRVAHVFPYDTRHLGIGVKEWAAGQLERWPLAAVARSDLADRSTVHVIGPKPTVLDTLPLNIVVHRSVASGPTWREWGDDWSYGLGRALRQLGPEDAAVIHLNDYAAARLAQRAAHRTRSVLVFHGRGTGAECDDHVRCASRLVVLREDAARELVAKGADPRAPAVFRPTVDTGRFFPPLEGSERLTTLGFVGRLEPAKGALELSTVLSRLRAEHPDVTLEVVGSSRPGDLGALRASMEAAGVGTRLHLLGERGAAEVGEYMRRWRLLLLPSLSEGFPLVVTEALACGLPVAAVTGVLPRELESEPLVVTAPRERYAELVAELVKAMPRGHIPDWVRGHRVGGQMWDELLSELPPFVRCGPVSLDRWSRVKRIRPLRKAVRPLRRWRKGTRRRTPERSVPR